MKLGKRIDSPPILGKSHFESCTYRRLRAVQFSLIVCGTFLCFFSQPQRGKIYTSLKKSKPFASFLLPIIPSIFCSRFKHKPNPKPKRGGLCTKRYPIFYYSSKLLGTFSILIVNPFVLVGEHVCVIIFNFINSYFRVALKVKLGFNL